MIVSLFSILSPPFSTFTPKPVEGAMSKNPTRALLATAILRATPLLQAKKVEFPVGRSCLHLFDAVQLDHRDR